MGPTPPGLKLTLKYYWTTNVIYNKPVYAMTNWSPVLHGYSNYWMLPLSVFTFTLFFNTMIVVTNLLPDLAVQQWMALSTATFDPWRPLTTRGHLPEGILLLLRALTSPTCRTSHMTGIHQWQEGSGGRDAGQAQRETKVHFVLLWKVTKVRCRTAIPGRTSSKRSVPIRFYLFIIRKLFCHEIERGIVQHIEYHTLLPSSPRPIYLEYIAQKNYLND